jgi:hypothetical protein
MKRKPRQSEISRREFARGIALGTATLAALPGALLEQTSVAASPAQPTPPSPTLTPAGEAEVNSRTQAILARYGDRLSDAQKADVRRLVTNLQTQLDKVRSYLIANDDAPATVLKPLVEREKQPTAPPSPAKSRREGA